ncbi:MAG: helix-hairpin-helix domain-containing protein [Putridiphycobacter sp.]
MKNYFNFTKSQKIGVMTIAVVILIQIVVLNYNKVKTVPNPLVVDNTDFLFEENNPKSEKSGKEIEHENAHHTKISYEKFNPNNYDLEDWVAIGFSEKQAGSILSFKNKINGFKTKNDLKKVYVISDDKFKEMEPFLIFESNSNNEFSNSTEKTSSQSIQEKSIELNSATKSDLIAVHGIGEYTAERIIKYKNLLGGFHSKEQLKEVYGMTEDNYQKIIPQVSIDKNNLKLVDVNEGSIPELKKHPYISWKIAEAIVNERMKGTLENLNFLVEDKNLLSQDELNKLLPYIKF